MFTIEVNELTEAEADYFTQTPAGETAIIVTTGVVIHSEFAVALPRETRLQPLTSIGDEHIYRVTVRGYTMDQFVAIANAYANQNFQEAEMLIGELSPSRKG